MVYFPSEIISQIVDELREAQSEVGSWTSYCLVSRQWHQALEPVLWRNIGFYFDDLETFCTHFASGERRRLLRSLRVNMSEYFKNSWDGSAHEESVESNDSDGSDGDDESNESGDAESETDSDAFESDDGEDWARPYEELPDRVLDFTENHNRFYKEIIAVWSEIRSWQSDLKLQSITIHVDGNSAYELLGPLMAERLESDDLLDDDWLIHPPLPMLPTVTSLTVSASKNIDIWPAIVGCDIASSLPNLQELRLDSADSTKSWLYTRQVFRERLAEMLGKLTQSTLHTVELLLLFRYCVNHDGDPGDLLRLSWRSGNRDSLSGSLNVLSQHLTTLSLNLGQISPALFWDPSVPFPPKDTLLLLLWPHLAHIHIDTGFETVSGNFSMRGPPHPAGAHHYYNDPPDAEDIIPDETAYGDYPTILFRVRPEPEYFDELAISIAQAATCMPALKSISLEMISYYTDKRKHTGYHGCGFAFRAGPDARYPAAHTRAWTGHPGIDLWELDRPRCEWVFRCEKHLLGWEEPQQAKELWEQRFPRVETGVVTFEDQNYWCSERFGFRIRDGEMGSCEAEDTNVE